MGVGRYERIVDLSAGGATRLVSVAFAFTLAASSCQHALRCRDVSNTYRQATQAVETQRLFEGSSSSCNACFLRLRCFGLTSGRIKAGAAPSTPTLSSCLASSAPVCAIAVWTCATFTSAASPRRWACGLAGAAGWAWKTDRQILRDWAQCDVTGACSTTILSLPPVQIADQEYAHPLRRLGDTGRAEPLLRCGTSGYLTALAWGLLEHRPPISNSIRKYGGSGRPLLATCLQLL
jgi:hypothetical protein